jgi:hypothetical protein
MKTELQEMGFEQSKADPCLYYKQEGERMTIVLLYVDDLFVVGDLNVQGIRKRLEDRFKMTDLGKIQLYLEVEFKYTKQGIFLLQEKYLKKVLEEFRMTKCNTAKIPILEGLKIWDDPDSEFVDAERYQRLIGKLLWLTTTRFDISFAVGLLSSLDT